MTQRRMTATNQLSTVTSALQLGKATGILTVERGEGETFEEGTIVFLHGQVVQAALGSSRGRDAESRLFAWKACRFLFAPWSPEDMDRRPSVPIFQESMDDVLRMLDRQGFSRAHRRLFLLIDGRRSIRELAALIGRDEFIESLGLSAPFLDADTELM